VSVPLAGNFDYEGRNQESQQRVDFLSCNEKSRLPAIGGGYASEGNAIGEKYWTFHAMDSTLKVSIMEGSHRSHRSHSRVIQGGTLRTTAIGHIDIS
jgi:hypothetical protein